MGPPMLSEIKNKKRVLVVVIEDNIIFDNKLIIQLQLIMLQGKKRQHTHPYTPIGIQSHLCQEIQTGE